jgi:hypothetical protein
LSDCRGPSSKATEAADVAAKAISRGALFGLLALLLGALAGWFGGPVKKQLVEIGLVTRKPSMSQALSCFSRFIA